MSKRIIIITQGVSRIVKPIVEKYNVVGIIESAPRKKKKGFINFLSSIYSYYVNSSKNLKLFSKKNNIPYYYMGNGNDVNLQNWVKELSPDTIVVYMMSQLLKKSIFDLPKYKTINLHPSYLPKYRGPNPWFWTYHNMDKVGGVTLHFIDEKEDTGDIIYQEEYEIPLGITSPEMHDLAIGKIGVNLILKALSRLEDLPRMKQPKESSTPRARNLKANEHSKIIKWHEWEIEKVWHLLRGTQLWLDAFEKPKGINKGQRWTIEKYERVEMDKKHEPSKVYKEGKRYFVACRDGKIYLSIDFGVKNFLLNLI